jgi:CBS domain-containing protein
MDRPMLEASRTGPSLEQLRVADAMHPGVVTCPLETPLREVARMMALYRIHAVVAFRESSGDVSGPGLWGVVSDLDLVRAVGAGAGELAGRTAGGTAVTPVVMVAPNELLIRAAQLMTEHEVTHLVVVDPESTRPIGVLSTIDIARALAGLS